MQLHAPIKLSRKRSLTAEGYLLCEETPVARIGVMLYGPDETPVEVGKDGIARIHRTPDEVFDAESMASMNGKSLVIDHPDEDVSPANWKKLTIGTVLNARRGTGVLEDYLVADLLITDKDAIEDVKSSKLSELSAGYDAQYEQSEPGIGRQHTIRYNHLAFVDQGRCGSMCAVRDRKLTTKDRFSMKKKFLSNLKAAFAKVLDEAAGEMMEESYDHSKDCEHGMPMKDCEKCKDKAKDEESEEMISTDSEEEKEKAKDAEEEKEKKDAKDKSKDESEEELEEGDKEEEEDEDEEEKSKSKDAASITKDSFNKIVARAEILSPGIKVPTFDGVSTKKTADALCSLKRRALTAAFADAKMKTVLANVIAAAPAVKTMDCATLNLAFVGASDIVRASNNKVADSTAIAPTKLNPIAAQVQAINKRNHEIWGDRA